MGKILVDLEDIQTIIDWWRGANEAPGGCSFKEAIHGMKDAVWNLETARRENIDKISKTAIRKLSKINSIEDILTPEMRKELYADLAEIARIRRTAGGGLD